MSIIEVCSTGIESSMTAEQNGADRIELCSVLECGGVTPSIGLVQSVLEAVQIPVKVLVRPREGNFIYTDREIDGMIRDIAFLKNLDVSGIVSGVLDMKGFIDESKLNRLIKASFPLPFTFFRAIDIVDRVEDGIRLLTGVGCKSVLTSGGKRTVSAGIDRILRMQEVAQGSMEIVAGGGISPESALELKSHGIKEFHLSGKKMVEVGLENELFDHRYTEVSGQIVAGFVSSIKGSDCYSDNNS